MITDLKPYAEYKESGLPWLGQVPGHWEVKRLKNWVSINARTLGEGTLQDFEFDYLDIGSVTTGRLARRPSQMVFGTAPSRARRVLTPGDTIVSTVRTYLKAVYTVGSFKSPLVASTGFAVLTPRPDATARCLGYVAESEAFTNQVTAESVGIAYPAISETKLGNISVTLPPPAEQALIVRFLDWANGRLERAIRAKRKVISLLGEQKQAIIHRAVTRGLDPSVPLKDSGVPWLGEIPKHWEVRRTKTIAHIKTGGRDTAHRVDAGIYPFFVRSQTVERINSFSFEGEAVLTAGDGAGVAKVFHHFIGRFDYHQRVYKFSNFERVSGRFFYRWLQSTLRFEALDASAKSTVDSLRLPLLQNFPTVVPPADEQAAIVEFVERNSLSIERVVSRLEREITLLREYRTRLVADVVTGKLDVRAAAAALPEEAPLEDATASPDSDDDALDTDDLTGTEGDET